MLGVVGINHAGLPVHPNVMQQTLDFQRGVERDSIHCGDGRRDKGIAHLNPVATSRGNMLGVACINYAGTPVHYKFKQQTEDANTVFFDTMLDIRRSSKTLILV